MFWIVGGRDVLLTFSNVFADPPPPWLQYQLSHPAWLGFTAWDMIMPLFLFIVGTAMPFSFSNRLEQGHTKANLYTKIIRRTLLLFIMGMVVQGHLLDFDLSKLSLYCNTLQAIAAGYLIAGLLILNVGLLAQIAATAGLLLGYWALLISVPIAGHEVGVLQPDANLALSVDQFLLGQFRAENNYTWILSSMGFAATVLLGVLSGHLLRSKLSPWQRVLALIAIGFACLAGGWIWDHWLGFPIIKHIWTSSMVLWAGGWSFLLLALFYLLIDVLNYRRWAFPFVVIGMNAITIYMANRFIPFDDIAETLVGGLASHLGIVGPALIALTTMSLVWFMLYHMYRHKIFLRL